jgi:GNAT superfamily N-acetyltransferase
MIAVRHMTNNDMDVVMRIQSMAYIPQYRESREIYKDKFDKFPDGCWIAEVDGQPNGYLLSHPCLLDNPPKLDMMIGYIPQNPDCYFIHDIAVNPFFKGKGIGRILCDKAKLLAKEYNLTNIALISVQNSHPFWEKMGFKRAIKLSAPITEKLKCYETDEFPDPKFMVFSSV